MEKKILEADSASAGFRIDKYLSLELPALSRSYIQKLVKDGACPRGRDGGKVQL